MILLQLLVQFLFLKICLAQLPTCTGSARCPTGGMWSEWAVTGKPTCPTSCGSCSKLSYTRTCLSTSINCPCSGDAFKYTLCNTRACGYPSQQSCCIPYLPMIMNSTLHCGPFPKDTSSPNTACCPSGGLWSDWSGFAKTGSSWVQTRQCLSSSLGCACTGSATNSQTTCPCPTLKTALDVRQLCIVAVAGTEASYSPNNMILDQDTCVLTGIVKANNMDIDWPCDNTMTWKNFLTGLVRVHGTNNQCFPDYPYDCAAIGTGSTMNISFTCDPSIQQWRYDWNGIPSDGYVLIQRTYRGGG